VPREPDWLDEAIAEIVEKTTGQARKARSGVRGETPADWEMAVINWLRYFAVAAIVAAWTVKFVVY
jgi:hypothetical protein